MPNFALFVDIVFDVCSVENLVCVLVCVLKPSRFFELLLLLLLLLLFLLTNPIIEKTVMKGRNDQKWPRGTRNAAAGNDIIDMLTVLMISCTLCFSLFCTFYAFTGKYRIRIQVLNRLYSFYMVSRSRDLYQLSLGPGWQKTESFGAAQKMSQNFILALY